MDTQHNEQDSKAVQLLVTRGPAIVIGLGLLAIILGYNGASGYTALSAQFPYLISGGILGLGLIVVGTGMFIQQSAREDSTRLEALLAQLVQSSGSLEQAPDDLTELLGSAKAGANPGYAPKPRAKR